MTYLDIFEIIFIVIVFVGSIYGFIRAVKSED